MGQDSSSASSMPNPPRFRMGRVKDSDPPCWMGLGEERFIREEYDYFSH